MGSRLIFTRIPRSTARHNRTVAASVSAPTGARMTVPRDETLTFL